MPSNQTPNYSLNQWERSDRVLMEDFNADNAKLDAAVAALAAKVSGKAEASALTALAQTVAGKAEKSDCLRIITGSFTGTGSADPVHISIGARPRLLIIATNNNIGNSNEKGRIVTENEINIYFTHTNTPVVTFINPITFNADGFTITHPDGPDRGYNRLGYEQRYWALC